MDLPDRNDYIQRQIAENGAFYELDLLQELGRLPLSEGIICDVGANIGNHSVYCAAFLDREVYSFEPLAAAYEILCRNIQLNRLEQRVKTFNVALGDQDQRGVMVERPGNMGASRFTPSPSGAVTMATLDSVVPEGVQVAAIKIDVEGYEVAVLRGAERLIRMNRPLLVVEVQTHSAYLEVSSVLGGYDYCPIGQKGKTPTVFFVPVEEWSRFSRFLTYLVRNDVEDVRRRVQGQLDRLWRKTEEIVEAGKALSSHLVGQDDLLKGLFADQARVIDDVFKGARDDVVRALDGQRELLEGDARRLGDLGTDQTTLLQRHEELHARVVDLGEYLTKHGAKQEETFRDLLSEQAVALSETLKESGNQVLRALEGHQHRLDCGVLALEGVSDRMGILLEKQDQQNERLSELDKTRRQELTTHEQAIKDLFVRQAELIKSAASSGADELALVLENQENVLDSVTESLISAVRQDLSKANRVFNASLEEIRQRTGRLEHGADKVQELETEIARLLVAVQTERTRARILSRRLHSLYTKGPRAVVGKLLTLLNRATRGWVSRYETWNDFEQRTECRVKRDIDDFKKLHSRVAALAGGESRSRQMEVDSAPSALMIGVKPPSSSVAEVRRERVRIGIASIEVRRTALSYVIACLYDQADEIFVYLNDYSEVPDFLHRDKITVIHGKGDIGDRGKFYGVEGFDGYFFSCDDDIAYPPYYVAHCIDAIERYGRKAIVGWHGSLIKAPFKDYYSNESRRVFSFRSGRPEDIAVHVLGTGCTAFHSSSIEVRRSDFETSNMADVYFALLGQRQGVPFVAIKHDAGEALPLEIPDDKPIHRESMQKTGSKADTRALQNELVIAHNNWSAVLPPLAFERPTPTVAYVGRLNKDRWKKGGILKSGHLILDALRSLGHRVIPVEIDQDRTNIFASIKEAKIVWIYPGDPERPDFEPVEALMEHAAHRGKQVYVNLSFNLIDSRTDWIAKKLEVWQEQFKGRVKACVFTYGAADYPDFSSVKESLICIPKTIDFDLSLEADFEETSGIFLGDLQKLLNRNLVGGDIEEWISAVRRELPGVCLYAVRQYGGKIDRDLGLEVVPYASGPEWEAWLARRRIVSCLTPHATFEMIPVESAGLGVPVVYRPMIHAHTEVLSSCGIQVRTPDEFGKTCKALYTDPTLWARFGAAGRHRAKSLHIQYASAAIHRQLVAGLVS